MFGLKWIRVFIKNLKNPKIKKLLKRSHFVLEENEITILNGEFFRVVSLSEKDFYILEKLNDLRQVSNNRYEGDDNGR